MFQNCDLKKLWAGYYDGHDASEYILKKIGFKEEGRIKEKLVDYRNCRVDHIIVGLLS
jgi:RimJ/RimL family protein N-acetyltransferase